MQTEHFKVYAAPCQGIGDVCRTLATTSRKNAKISLDRRSKGIKIQLQKAAFACGCKELLLSFALSFQPTQQGGTSMAFQDFYNTV
ncbi:hypothetical protein, partial [Methylothermus subterraneus]